MINCLFGLYLQFLTWAPICCFF